MYSIIDLYFKHVWSYSSMFTLLLSNLVSSQVLAQCRGPYMKCLARVCPCFVTLSCACLSYFFDMYYEGSTRLLLTYFVHFFFLDTPICQYCPGVVWETILSVWVVFMIHEFHVVIIYAPYHSIALMGYRRVGMHIYCCVISFVILFTRPGQNSTQAGGSWPGLVETRDRHEFLSLKGQFALFFRRLFHCF